MKRFLLVTSVLLFGCETTSTPEGLMRAFYSVETTREMCKYVVGGSEICDKLEKYYQDRGTTPQRSRIISVDSNSKEPEMDRVVEVSVNVKNRVSGVTGTRKFCLRRQMEGYAMEWENSIGLNEMTLGAYQALKLEGKHIFSVKASLDDSDIGNCSHFRGSVYAVRLYEESTGQHGFVCLNVDGDDTLELLALLKGGTQRVRVALEHLRISRYDYFIITDMIQKGWCH